VDIQIRTHVSLRLFGEDLDPDAITKEVGITADKSYRNGEITGTKTRVLRKTGYWSVSSREHMDELVDTCAHLQWLIDIVDGRKAIFDSYRARGWRVDVWLGIHTSEGHGGPTIPSSIIRALGAIDLDVNLDLYPNEGV
jgi:hypothetical protein